MQLQVWEGSVRSGKRSRWVLLLRRTGPRSKHKCTPALYLALEMRTIAQWWGGILPFAQNDKEKPALKTPGHPR